MSVLYVDYIPIFRRRADIKGTENWQQKNNTV